MLDADVRELQDLGFVVVRGAVPPREMDRMSRAYDAAVATAAPEDVKVGSSTTRVNDFVNRGAEFDCLYIFPPLLDACEIVISGAFKLSSLHARTLRPRVPAQDLHVDVRRESADWPLLGFILMVDEFRPDNGATRFVPGSHLNGVVTRDAPQVLACGAAGSLIVFNGSTWHGYSANVSDDSRRSLQGAFIPRTGRAGTDFAARMTPDTRARLGARARDVLGV